MFLFSTNQTINTLLVDVRQDKYFAFSRCQSTSYSSLLRYFHFSNRLIMPRPAKLYYSHEKPPCLYSFNFSMFSLHEILSNINAQETFRYLDSYIALTTMAIQHSPEKMLPLSDIYKVNHHSRIDSTESRSCFNSLSSLLSNDFLTIEQIHKNGKTHYDIIYHLTTAS